MMEKEQQENQHLQAEGTMGGLGQGHQLNTTPSWAVSHRNWSHSRDSAPHREDTRGRVGRGILAYPFLLPSSLLPGALVGQTQQEASWRGNLGMLPPMTVRYGREQSRAKGKNGLKDKMRYIFLAKRRSMRQMTVKQKKDAGLCPVWPSLFLPRDYLKSEYTR